MFTGWLDYKGHLQSWKGGIARFGLLALYVLMTAQFVGCYLFHTSPYLDLHRFASGYERLPFQTRLLTAPLFGWAEHSPRMVHYASKLARNTYFFPHGIRPTEVVEFWLDIPCLLIAGWVAVQIYQAASRRHLLGWLVYPLFLVLCTVSYLLHTVQNFRFVYDLPSLMFFSLGLYIIYFRKPVIWLVALFALATLNRETTLFLIPFYVLSDWVRGREAQQRLSKSEPTAGPFLLARSPAEKAARLTLWKKTLRRWRGRIRPEAIAVTCLLLAYWAAWHLFVFHVFRSNPSEYYSRLSFNIHCFERLRYYPQLFSACGYLLPFLLLFHRRMRDSQLRAWLLVIPFWYCVMAVWGILVETRVFGELLPFVATAATLMAEEVLAVHARRWSLTDDDEDEDDRMQLVRAA